MPDPQVVGPVPLSTPPELRRGPRRQLPKDLLREASRRVAIMALVGAALWTAGTATYHVVGLLQHRSDWLLFRIPDAIAVGSVILSLALFVYARRNDHDPRAILDLALGYMVVTALALGNMLHWGPSLMQHTVSPELSWIGVVVVVFAAITPSTPGKTLVAALLAVSMNPVGMLIARERGMWDFGPTSNVLIMHFPDYLLAGVAVVISHVVTRLGQQVARARDLGSYQLGELLGRGGMGEVYKATHRMLARPAAIKLIRPEMLGERSANEAKLTLARFRREAEAAATLRSPHTVELYDFGVAEDGSLYFVMELLDGMDAERLVRQKGPVPAARAIYLLRQVCESLEEAHVRGLVHRDIKPANIHVGRLGLRYDFVKVLDFGLVKSIANAVADQSLETAAGTTPGTPAYMAPEMVTGGTVDGRADIYALGCVGYFLLTGRLVFEASTALQMIARHLQEQPVAPSCAAELPVPPALDELVLACLAKKPEDRPPSAAALARKLAAIDAGAWDDDLALRWWQVNLPEVAIPAAASAGLA